MNDDQIEIEPNLFLITATSILGFQTYVVNVGEPIDVGDGVMERPIRFQNKLKNAAKYTLQEAENLLPFVTKVREDAKIIPA